MSRTEAQKQAQKRYSDKLKYVQLKFTPEEAEFLEHIKIRSKSRGGLNAYIKSLLEEDIAKGE